MKAILICPSERHELEYLTGTKPLAALPLFGESVLDLWLAHLSATGVKQVKILAADRFDIIKRLVGSGEKWGIEATVFSEAIEPTKGEARKKHKPAEATDYLAEPEDVQVVDHLPWDDTYPMFADYASWFQCCRTLLQRIQPGFRVGMRQLKPGVWVGRETQIAPSAKLHGPCWIGRGVHIGPNADVGPNVIIEDETFIDETAELVEAWVGPQTFVGALTRVTESLAWGHTLINHKTASHIVVPDPFLLSSVEQARTAVKTFLAPKRLPAFLQERFARPIASLAGLKAKLPG
jgi:NDP-sugar pyrophosphorylase family protein